MEQNVADPTTPEDLTELSDDELTAENERLMAKRAAFEALVKADQMRIQAEMNKRASVARVTRTLESLSVEDQEIMFERLRIGKLPALDAPEGLPDPAAQSQKAIRAIQEKPGESDNG